jgi:hypothetical protein
MPESLQIFHHQHALQNLEIPGTTTSDLILENMVGELKSPRDLEGENLHFWTCSAVSAIRTDLPLSINTVAQSIVSPGQNVAIILVQSSHSVKLLANMRRAERTDRSEPAFFYANIKTDDFRNQFHLRLVSELELEAVEDGISHAVERIMQDLLTRSSQVGRDWIKATFYRLLEEGKDSAAAGLLQCIGRSRSTALETAARDLISEALAHRNAEIREAAISATEQLGTHELISLLRSHSDAVEWLSRYAQQVVAELSDDHS